MSLKVSIFQCAHVTTKCGTRSMFKVGLATISWKKIAYAPSALPLLGPPQALSNKPNPLPKVRYFLGRKFPGT